MQHANRNTKTTHKNQQRRTHMVHTARMVRNAEHLKRTLTSGVDNLHTIKCNTERRKPQTYKIRTAESPMHKPQSSIRNTAALKANV